MAYPSNQPDDISELEGMEKGGVDAPKTTLENLSFFADRYIELDRELKELDTYASKLEEEQRAIEETTIPTIMEGLNMINYTMKDNFKLEIESKFQGSVAVKDQARAEQQLKWVESSGGGDIIKISITCDFSKGHEKEAQELIKLLTELGIAYKAKKSVHASTLASYVKAKIAAATEVPLDDLGWRFFPKASVKKKGFKLRKRRKNREDWSAEDEEE